MEQLIELLKNVNDTIDYENETGFLSKNLLDSIDITELIAQLEETYDIEITVEYLTPQYFDSVEAILGLIEELS